MLMQDGYKIDGNTAHVVGIDGVSRFSFDATGETECGHCGKALKIVDRFSKGILLRSTRIFTFHERTFCSDACRQEAWMAPSEPFAKIDTPATLEVYTCSFCQPTRTLVGVGEIFTRVDGDRLITMTRDEQDIDCAATVTEGDCVHCLNSRVERPAPMFYSAHPGDFGWRDQWSSEQFDVNIRATVYELDPGQFQLWDITEDMIYLRMDRVKLQCVFATPYDFNAWWMAPSTSEEEKQARKDYLAVCVPV